MKIVPVVLSLLLSLSSARAAALPGFRAELLGLTEGFVTSIASDSHGTIFYTTTSGSIFRFGSDEPIARVDTVAIGNSGLLGMTLLDDRTAVVHYTTPNQTHDVVSRIDLTTGAETVLHRFVGDLDLPERGTPSEHHGGNPTLGPNGSVFVGIGDYGISGLARREGWNAGRIFHIDAIGRVTEYAKGYRNPFDMVWDDRNRRLITSDNGPVGGDEIHIITEGADAGWPLTVGFGPPQPGTVPPDYVWDFTVAPTGMTLLRNEALLVGSFVPRALYYFPKATSLPLAKPVAVIERETAPVIDVAQSRDGRVFFATIGAIYQLVMPIRGDCNADSFVTSADLDALTLEIADNPSSTTDAQNGAFRGSWGCDANEDGLINEGDRAELLRILSWRRRAIRTGR